MTIAALCTDLFFASRIAEVAKTLGVTCLGARDVATLLTRARGDAPTLVIVDMILRDADAALAIRTLRADAATRDARIVAFLPHVEEALAEAAHAAGAHEVLTRGQLTKRLPALLAPPG